VRDNISTTLETSSYSFQFVAARIASPRARAHAGQTNMGIHARRQVIGRAIVDSIWVFIHTRVCTRMASIHGLLRPCASCSGEQKVTAQALTPTFPQHSSRHDAAFVSARRGPSQMEARQRRGAPAGTASLHFVQSSSDSASVDCSSLSNSPTSSASRRSHTLMR
jgi:hypothetical protein